MSINIDDAPDAQEKREQILVFRTITSLLSDVPRRTPILCSDFLEDLSKKHRETIKVYDALAHVLVMEHEVIAVASDHTFEVEAGETLRIVASASQERTQVEKATGTFSNYLMKIVLSWNPLNKADPKKSGQTVLPLISPTDRPRNVTKETVLTYIENVAQHSTLPNMHQHLWTITNALVAQPIRGLSTEERRAHRSRLSQGLMKYICIASFKKIRRRFNNKALSVPYFNALVEVDTQGLPSIPIEPFPSSQKKEDSEAYMKMKSDRLFLEDFILKLDNAKGNKDVPLINTSIPNLTKKAKELPPSQDGGFQLYTDETREEFHALLLEILQGFKANLDSLQNSSPGCTEFSIALKNLYRNGYLLLRISRGLAYQMHLKSISDRLSGVLSLPRMDPLDDPELDAEILSILGLTLQKSFVAWLRLMVGHFDAAEYLARFATSPAFSFSDISTTFLTAEEPDAQLLPWQELFDRNLLPETGGTRPADAAITNAMIHQFLVKNMDDATFGKAILDDTLYIKKHLEVIPLLPIDKLVPRKLAEMQKKIEIRIKTLNARIDALDAEVAAKSIDSAAASYKKASLQDSRMSACRIQEEFKIVEGKVKTVTCDVNDSVNLWFTAQNKWFTSTQRFFTSLAAEKELQGTLHCEAYLASLLPLHPDSSRPALAELTNILKPFQAQEIGVSKRCCPVCVTYLDIIQGGAQGPSKFLVGASHDRVSACTLPQWTPLVYLKAMTNYWGGILREDLLGLMEQDPFRRRQRSNTTGSMGRSSHDSLNSSVSNGPYTQHDDLIASFDVDARDSR